VIGGFSGHPANRRRYMAQVFEAADQKVTEEGDMVKLLVIVDAEKAAYEYHISLLAPVFVGPGQIFSRSVRWRGSHQLAAN